MSTQGIIVVGGGGHAAVVADALLAAGERVLGFVDADPSRHGRQLCGLPVLGGDEVLCHHAQASVRLANGIGGVRVDDTRRTVQQRLEAQGWRFVTVRHPSSIVSTSARVADGAQLFAGSIVQAGASVGEGCIVNTAAVIEHDAVLGTFVHVAPRALLCGEVRVGGSSHVGAGAIVRQGVVLGERTLVAAGAVVVSDFNGDGVLIGVPARPTGRQR